MYALVDCNNFFVSCERLFRPELQRRPVAVLSNNDGCIISRSQEVKNLGIAMGAPLFQVQRLVSGNAVTLFSANFELYGDISQRIVSLLRQEAPLIEVYSIDECFMDLSQLSIGDYQQWAGRVRTRIWREIGIPVSIGIAGTKTLAKVASTYSKLHGGVYVVDSAERREQLLRQVPIEDIWGIGRRTAPKLRDKGVSYAWQLVSASDNWLRQQFTISGIRTVDELRGTARIAFGDKQDSRQQIMRSRSFGHRVRSYHQLESAVATFASQVALKLRAQASLAKRVTVFLSTGKGAAQQKRVGIAVVLPEASYDTARLIAAALQGLEQIYDPDFAYQKAGVAAVDLVTHDEWQLSLTDPQRRRDETKELMHAIDDVNKKYGSVLWYAIEKPRDADWHSRRERRSPGYTTNWSELPVLKVSV